MFNIVFPGAPVNKYEKRLKTFIMTYQSHAHYHRIFDLEIKIICA